MMAAEGLIQFFWKHSLYRGRSLYTASGQKLEVLDPGEQNPHAGPDFFNARIRLGRIIWAGNVEIHSCASDWYRHGHHLDPSYNNVILHVVGDYDTDITSSQGRRIETLQLSCHENSIRRYYILKKSESWLPCGDYIQSVPDKIRKHWLRSLYTERISRKIHSMEQIFHDSGLDPDEALYRVLAQGYGVPVNTLPFELLAKKVPRSALIDYRDSVTDLEAILFGHSGLLQPARQLGTYPSTLWNRYMELKHLFTDRPLPHHMWRFLRLRPPSFPTLRISQFASLIYQRSPLAESILQSASMSDMEQIFRSCASEYWTNHYLFGKGSPPMPKYPGEQFISTLIINAIIPYLNALDKFKGRSRNGIRTGEIMENLKAESNQIIKKWSIFGVRAGNARESQALLQLYHVFCKQKRCLDCQIGAVIVQDAIRKKK